MPNTTVSIRERIKTADGRWTWGPAIPLPDGELKPAEAQRRGNFYLVFTERGKKREPKVKGKTFEAAVLAGRAKYTPVPRTNICYHDVAARWLCLNM